MTFVQDERQKNPLVRGDDVGIDIYVEPPRTKSNFLEYNKACDALEMNRLMPPINEAEYDSETQVCVDRKNDGPRSYFDHYVNRPNKKLGLHVGFECPTCECQQPAPSCEDYLQAPPAGVDLPLRAVSRDVLRDPVARRLASGRLPPNPPDAAE